MYNYLFNFSSSFSGGGLKRLEEFSKWFSLKGGATFLINEKSSFLIAQYPNNKYIVPTISKISRILNKESYLDSYKEDQWDLYYSYGIPITRRVAKKNILHISNVLPFLEGDFGYDLVQKLRFLLLKYFFFNSFQYTDVLSAESEYSINLFDGKFTGKTMVSKNGSDDEINLFLKEKKENLIKEYQNYAIVLGTHKHKNLEGSYQLFNEIRKKNSDLKLIIIGSKEGISKEIANDSNVQLKGVMKRSDVMDLLCKATYYISTTRIENSYNAASEAIFLAKESYISTIPPHFELLKNLKYDVVHFQNNNLESIHLKAKDLDINNLVKWEEIIQQIVYIDKK